MPQLRCGVCTAPRAAAAPQSLHCTSCRSCAVESALHLVLWPDSPLLTHAAAPAHTDVEISYVDAILGTTVKVTTLGTNELSEVDLKIPAGALAGAREEWCLLGPAVWCWRFARFNAEESFRCPACPDALGFAWVPILPALSHLGTGTQPGTTLVMSKRGVPKLGSNARGDHLVHVKVGMLCRGQSVQYGAGQSGSCSQAWAVSRLVLLAVSPQVKIPKTISGEERKLMEQLRELQGAKPASRGWF